jgi:hypothetical protein
MIAALVVSFLAPASYFLAAASAKGRNAAAPAAHSLQSPCADAQEHSLPLPTTVAPAQFVEFEKTILAFLQSGEYKRLGLTHVLIDFRRDDLAKMLEILDLVTGTVRPAVDRV